MNSLRKLLAEYGRYADDNGGSVDALAYDDCATQLSSAIPAWERLVVTAGDAAQWLTFLADNDDARKAVQELREALEGVKAK